MKYRRLRKLIMGLLAIVLLAGQIPFTYIYAQGKDETLSANTVEDIKEGSADRTETVSENEVSEEFQKAEAVQVLSASV